MHAEQDEGDPDCSEQYYQECSEAWNCGGSAKIQFQGHDQWMVRAGNLFSRLSPWNSETTVSNGLSGICTYILHNCRVPYVHKQQCTWMHGRRQWNILVSFSSSQACLTAPDQFKQFKVLTSSDGSSDWSSLVTTSKEPHGLNLLYSLWECLLSSASYMALFCFSRNQSQRSCIRA